MYQKSGGNLWPIQYVYSNGSLFINQPRSGNWLRRYKYQFTILI